MLQHLLPSCHGSSAARLHILSTKEGHEILDPGSAEFHIVRPVGQSDVGAVRTSVLCGIGLQPLDAPACSAPLIVYPEPAIEEVVGELAGLPNRTSESAPCEMQEDLRRCFQGRGREFFAIRSVSAYWSQGLLG